MHTLLDRHRLAAPRRLPLPPDMAAPVPDAVPHAADQPTVCQKIGRLVTRTTYGALACTLALTGPAMSNANAQDGILGPGDAVVTGFSGIKPTGDPVPPGGSALDGFFIDLDGPSAQILSLNALSGTPQGQLLTTAPKFVLKARDVGQVFAITFDDGLGLSVPNFFLAATAAYGIHIARPDPANPEKFLRLRKGHAEAQWMPGMFAGEGGGNPGSIVKVDGRTGATSIFATLPGNSGAGIGDIVFDKASRNLYASDLDTGMIHRFDGNGVLLDAFDHGTTGRPAKGLAPVGDDGSVMDITNPAFDTEDTSGWGFTQPERRVHGMAVNGGRLYYAVTGGRQVWSVGISGDGSFAGDPRWELDVTGLPGDGPITDILFDGNGRMYLAQRGSAKGSYAYAEFAVPEQSAVLRYRLEQPDDPATESRWVPDPETYAIGTPDPHRNANGGIALGFAHDDKGRIKPGTRNSMLWSTGERLRTSAEDAADPAAEIDVHGLQGNATGLVRPDNEPPTKAYFLDYDGLFNDPEKAGHLGDVEIWQPVGDFAGVPETVFPPDYVPPFIEPPGIIPPPPPPPGYDLNLKLTKRADPKECFDQVLFWLCEYRVYVRNTSLEHAFAGPIRVQDELINLPAGSAIQVPQSPFPWSCWWVTAPNKFACQREAFLPPGTGVGFNVRVRVPKTEKRCRLTNIAEIMHPFGGTWQNTDPLDDIDSATAIIPDPDCKPNGLETNLKIQKWADPQMCWDIGGGDHYCRFLAVVWNDGPGVFTHKLSVQDDPTAGTFASFGGDFTCIPNGAGHLCDSNDDPLTLFPFEARLISIGMEVPRDVAIANNCKILNKISIVTPHGAGHPMNLDDTDDSSDAFASIPAEVCEQVLKEAAIECPPGYIADGNNCVKKSGRKPEPLPVVPPPPVIACPDDMRPVAKSRLARLRRQGWELVELRNGRWCGRPGEVVTPTPVSCPKDMRRVSLLAIPRLRRANWTLRRMSDGRWCGRPPEPVDPIYCPQGYREVSRFQARRLRNLGWSVVRRAQGRRIKWCAKPPIDPPKPPCIGGRLTKSQGKWLCVCPANTIRQSIGNNGGARCLPRPPKQCAKDERTVRSTRLASLLRRQGYSVRRIDARIWCAKKPKVCPPGTTGKFPRCKPKVCPPGTIGKYPRCKPLVCPPGTVGKYPRCKPKVCPPGTIGKYPRCKPKVCPPGTVGKYPRCKPKVCPPGTVGKYPRCKPKVCPPGTVGKYPRCKPRVCPPGTVGKYPRCKPKVCPPGTVGKYPRCKPRVCPPGTVGKYPRCKPKVIRKCPPHMTGRPPNCKLKIRPIRPVRPIQRTTPQQSTPQIR